MRQPMSMNPGSYWCLNMWTVARLILDRGCRAAHVNCKGTDMGFVFAAFEEGDRGAKALGELPFRAAGRLVPVLECLEKLCPEATSTA